MALIEENLITKICDLVKDVHSNASLKVTGRLSHKKINALLREVLTGSIIIIKQPLKSQADILDIQENVDATIPGSFENVNNDILEEIENNS